MFRKALITIAAAVSMSSAAFAQFNPNEPAYVRANGPQAANEYNRADDNYPQQNTGYNPQAQYGPQNQGGYGPQGQGGYAPQQQQQQQQQPNYPQQQQPQVGPSIDMRSVQPGQSQQYRYMMPQGWRPMEAAGVCLIASPDMTMAYGLMAPGTVQSKMSADAYMKDTLTRVAQFQNVQILNGQRGQVQAPFTESGCFMISYSSGGQQFVGMVTCAVAQTQNGTYGFLQMVIGTQQALQANGQQLMQLLQSVMPLNPQQGAPTNNGPVNNGPATNAPVVNAPVNPNPAYQPASYPNSNAAPATNGGPVNPLER